MLSLVRYQVMDLGQVSIVSEPRPPVALEFSVCLSGTKKHREQQQRVAETAVSVILLCLPIVTSMTSVAQAWCPACPFCEVYT